MVEYLIKLPGIHDPEMDDGTTGFAMALARNDTELIKILMESDHPSDINPIQLSRYAIKELEREHENCSAVLKVLKNRSVQGDLCKM